MKIFKINQKIFIAFYYFLNNKMKTELVIFDSVKNSKKGTLKGLTAIILLIVFDSIWLTIMKKFYKKNIGNIMGKFRIIGGLFAWFFIACALSVQSPKSLREAMTYGALVGLVIYSVYNGTNYAIMKNWNIKLSFVDTIWGTIICSVTSAILYKIFKNY